MAEEQKKRGVLRAVFNVRQWIAIDELLIHSRGVKRAFKAVYAQETAQRSETFEAAMQRLQLKEADVITRKRFFLYSAIFYFIFGVSLILYCIYLVKAHGHFLAVFLTVILALLMFVYSIREHFWYMQIAKRKLGCGYKEWLAFIFRRARA
jgi:intracellular multiplication protein IcmV